MTNIKFRNMKNRAGKSATDSLTTLSVATLHWTTLPPLRESRSIRAIFSQEQKQIQPLAHAQTELEKVPVQVIRKMLFEIRNKSFRLHIYGFRLSYWCIFDYIQISSLIMSLRPPSIFVVVDKVWCLNMYFSSSLWGSSMIVESRWCMQPTHPLIGSEYRLSR